MGSCASIHEINAQGEDMSTEIAYAETCLANGARCRANKDYFGAVEWFNEALRVQCARYSIPLEASEEQIEAVQREIERDNAGIAPNDRDINDIGFKTRRGVREMFNHRDGNDGASSAPRMEKESSTVGSARSAPSPTLSASPTSISNQHHSSTSIGKQRTTPSSARGAPSSKKVAEDESHQKGPAGSETKPLRRSSSAKDLFTQPSSSSTLKAEGTFGVLHRSVSFASGGTGRTRNSLVAETSTASSLQGEDHRAADAAAAATASHSPASNVGSSSASLQQQTIINYHEPHVKVLIELGQTYAMSGIADLSAFLYFFQAVNIIDPLMSHLRKQRSTALPYYVEATVGIVLILTNLVARRSPKQKAAVNPLTKTQQGGKAKASSAELAPLGSHNIGPHNNLSLWAYLNGYHPLDLAEIQLKRAVAVVEEDEGPRSPLLVCLFHLQTRVLISRKRYRMAQPIMQRCLGLTWSFGTTASDAPALVRYSRLVLRFIKYELAKEENAVKIQRWWLERIVPRLELRRAMLATSPAFMSPANAGSPVGVNRRAFYSRMLYDAACELGRQQVSSEENAITSNQTASGDGQLHSMAPNPTLVFNQSSSSSFTSPTQRQSSSTFSSSVVGGAAVGSPSFGTSRTKRSFTVEPPGTQEDEDRGNEALMAAMDDTSSSENEEGLLDFRKKNRNKKKKKNRKKKKRNAADAESPSTSTELGISGWVDSDVITAMSGGGADDFEASSSSSSSGDDETTSPPRRVETTRGNEESIGADNTFNATSSMLPRPHSAKKVKFASKNNAEDQQQQNDGATEEEVVSVPALQSTSSKHSVKKTTSDASMTPTRKHLSSPTPSAGKLGRSTSPLGFPTPLGMGLIPIVQTTNPSSESATDLTSAGPGLESFSKYHAFDQSTLRRDGGPSSGRGGKGNRSPSQLSITSGASAKKLGGYHIFDQSQLERDGLLPGSSPLDHSNIQNNVDRDQEVSVSSSIIHQTMFSSENLSFGKRSSSGGSSSTSGTRKQNNQQRHQEHKPPGLPKGNKKSPNSFDEEGTNNATMGSAAPPLATPTTAQLPLALTSQGEPDPNALSISGLMTTTIGQSDEPSLDDSFLTRQETAAPQAASNNLALPTNTTTEGVAATTSTLTPAASADLNNHHHHNTEASITSNDSVSTPTLSGAAVVAGTGVSGALSLRRKKSEQQTSIGGENNKTPSSSHLVGVTAATTAGSSSTSNRAVSPGKTSRKTSKQTTEYPLPLKTLHKYDVSISQRGLAEHDKLYNSNMSNFSGGERSPNKSPGMSPKQSGLQHNRYSSSDPRGKYAVPDFTSSFHLTESMDDHSPPRHAHQKYEMPSSPTDRKAGSGSSGGGHTPRRGLVEHHGRLSVTNAVGGVESGRRTPDRHRNSSVGGSGGGGGGGGTSPRPSPRNKHHHRRKHEGLRQSVDVDMSFDMQQQQQHSSFDGGVPQNLSFVQSFMSDPGRLWKLPEDVPEV